MKIYITDGNGDVQWLAGSDDVPARLWTGAAGYTVAGAIAEQENQYFRGANGSYYDRKNLRTTITFSTKRTFDSAAEAFLHTLDYDATAIRAGDVTLVVEGSDGGGVQELRRLNAAVVQPPGMTVIGAAVTLEYTIHGGAITGEDTQVDPPEIQFLWIGKETWVPAKLWHQ